MNNVKMNIGKDGNVSLECSQEAALEMINSLINRGINRADHKKPSFDTSVVEKQTRKYSKKTSMTKVAWLEEEIRFIANNLSVPKMWRSPVLKLHTRKAIDAMKSRIKNEQYDGVGIATAEVIKRIIKERDNRPSNTDYLGSY